MKKLKKIELSRVDLNPDAKLSSENMQNLEGGGGCICYNNPFNMWDGKNPNSSYCACYHNPFGFCSNVNGGGSPSTGGHY